ncbi:coiled-coil domain-containing 42 like-2-like protein [Labeo rohita]|uniref:Coiled-coil domain-containing 42 like-2-like protein n=1 Tax=Labeo rohita TaxID=84645 RepID=A0A498MFQ2_LABRO|nr:coiled-coil domain-containing 42 like-2-like protein [Labeo rohita]
MRREHLNKRAENVKKDQEKLRQFKLENEETLKKNEARRLCAIERIKENKAKIKVTEEDIKKLKERYEALLARKELLELQVKQHQESTAKMPGKLGESGEVVAVVDVEPAVVELMDSVVLYIGHVSSILSHGKDGGTETFVHSLQPVTCTTPVKTTQKNDNVQNQGAWEESL